MVQAELRVTLPDATWIGTLSRTHPTATFRVLASMQREAVGVGLLEIQGSDPAAVVDAMTDAPGLLSVDTQAVDADRALVSFETDQPLLLLSAGGAGVPIEPPVVIADGVATVSVTAPRDRLSALGDSLEAFGLSYDLRSVHEATTAPDLLTDRQHEFVVRARELGYYSVPRAATLTEVADDLDVAKSTASEVLARAESKLVERYLGPDERPENE